MWTGRRTYSLACGLELLAARSGGAAFDAVDARLHPAFVLADTLHEQKLVDTLIAKGWQLAYLDLSWSVFARPRSGDASTVSAPATAMTVDADPARMLDAENRPVDAAFAAGALGVACSVVRRSAGDDAARGVCAAAAQATRR